MNQTFKTIGIAVIVIAVIGAAVFVFGNMRHAAPAPTVAVVGTHDVVREVSSTGTVSPVAEYNLSFGTSGVLANVYAHKGDTVRAGQLLATLDASDIAMQRASAHAVLVGDQEVAATNLTNAQQAYVQLKKANAAAIANATQKVLDARAYMNKAQDIFTDVSNDGDIDTTSITYITAAQSLASAKNAYNEAVTSLRTLQATAAQSETAASGQVASVQVGSQRGLSVNQAQLGYQNAVLQKTVLRAPSAGIVTSENVQTGEYASPAQPTMTIISSDLQIETRVSEADITAIKVGQGAHVTFDAIGLSESFDATVSAVDSAATQQNGMASYKVTLRLVKEDSRIRSGMTANIAIPIAEKKDVLAVPSDAVFADGNAFFVNILESNTPHKQTVVLGVRGTNGYDEIVSGVQADQKVLSFSTK